MFRSLFFCYLPSLPPVCNTLFLDRWCDFRSLWLTDTMANGTQKETNVSHKQHNNFENSLISQNNIALFFTKGGANVG
jgi:hypothetical protein